MWFNTRYIAGQTLDDLNSSCNSIQSFRVSRIQDAIKTLSSLSEEDVELLRTKFILYSSFKRDDLNSLLFNLSCAIPTRYSESNPALDSDVEKLIYGEDSNEYKSRQSLKELYKETNPSEGFLHSKLDNRSSGDDVSDERFKNLSDSDLDYLLSLRRHEDKEDFKSIIERY